MKGMMLLETEASLRARHEADQKRQMEEARLARKESYEREASASANGPGKNLPRGKSKRGEKSPPPDPTAAAFRAVDGVTDDVDALEREVNDAARAASESGLEEKTHAGLNNRLEKALLALDGVDAMGNDEIRAVRKSLVGRVNGLCEALDMAYSRYGRP
jgi:hypothetical protein|eukprot:31258-Pelagococcus_subviridis.AAC.4